MDAPPAPHPAAESPLGPDGRAPCFTTSGRLVGPLLLTPDPVIRLAADLVVAGVVEYARSRFVTGVRDSLLAWDGVSDS